jgi:hypothetical protein
MKSNPYQKKIEWIDEEIAALNKLIEEYSNSFDGRKDLFSGDETVMFGMICTTDAKIQELTKMKQYLQDVGELF